MPDEITEPMTDNEALNAIVVELEDIADSISKRYDSIQGDSELVAVSDTAPVTRSAVATAIKAVVVNAGEHSVRVYFDNIFVALVPAGQSKELPMAGTSPIKVDCATGEASLIAVAIFKKTV